MKKKRIVKVVVSVLATGILLNITHAIPINKIQAGIQNRRQEASPSAAPGSTPSGEKPPALPDGNAPGENPPSPSGSNTSEEKPPASPDGNALGENLPSPPDGNTPGGNGNSSPVTLSGANTADGKDITYDGTGKDALLSSLTDENTVLATNGGSYTITNAVLGKSGNCSNNDNSNFYAVNAILAASGNSSAYISGTKLTSSSEGSNALFATGSNSKIYAKDVSINTTGNSARGLDATYEGTIIASDINITTKGNHCGAVATDRGNGYISVKNAKLNTSGQGSPLIYSTGVIEAENITGEASGAQITGMEGLNTVRIKNSTLAGSAKKASEPVANGIIIYQSMSGDSSTGTANFEVSGSKLKSYITGGAMFYITNTSANIVLSDTKLDFDSNKNTLLTAGGNDGSNNWGKAGSNGANVTLTADSQELKGDISCDGISNVNIYIVNKSSYTGSIINNTTYTGNGGTSINLGSSSVWTVTKDSLLKSLNAAKGSVIQDTDGKTVTIKTTDGTTMVNGNSSITITTGTYSDNDNSQSAGTISAYTIDRSGFDKYFSGNSSNNNDETASNNNDNSKNSNIEITGIDDIPEEHTTEIKEPGKTIITKISSTRNSIKLKWKKAKKCQGYIISRSTKKHYGYKEIATIKNNKKTSYTDKNLKKNKKYYYYIKAYNSKGNITVYGKYSKVTGIKTKK